MNNNDEKWISKKELVVPIVSIIAFAFLLIGASYAYYTSMTGSPTQTSTNNPHNPVPSEQSPFVASAPTQVREPFRIFAASYTS